MSAGTLTGQQRAAAGTRELTLVRAVSSPVVLTVVALTALAAVLRFVGIGHQGFWFDEANTALLVHFSPGKMLGLIPQSESTPPLYYCVAWVWARIFGYGEAGLRSLSALCGVLTVPVAYGAGRKLLSERAGVFAAALTACNPFLIWYSQEARSYSMLVLLTAVALLAFAYALADPTPRTVLAWVVASALALATHYYALLAIVPQAIWLLAVHWRRRPAQVGVAVVGLCGLALIPLALSQNATGHAGWIAKFPLGPRLGQIIPQFVIGTGAPAYDVLEPLGAATIVVGLVLLLFRAERTERRTALRVGALAVGGLLLNLVLIAGGVDDLLTRNVIALWLPAAIVVAAGFGARRAGLIGVCAGLVLCGIGVAAAVGVAANRNLQRPDWRGVARVLEARPGPAGARASDPPPALPRPPATLALPPRASLLAQSPPREGQRARRGLDQLTPGAAVLVGRRVQSVPLADAELLSDPGLPRAVGPPRLPVHDHAAHRRPEPTMLTPAQVSRVLTTTTLRHDELLLQR